MESDQLKIGDVVRANSGGPLMTLNAKVGVLHECVWFDGNNVFHRQSFDEKALFKVVDHPKN